MQPLWSASLGSPLRGLSFAREKGWLLAWDSRHTLHLYERGGSCRWSRPAPGPVAACCLAEDGDGLAIAGASGQVWFCDAELAPRWERRLPQAGLAVATDPFSRIVAASDTAGNLHLFDRQGNPLGQSANPRPFRHLAFVPEQPRLVAAADFGLVACFDARADLLWRDGLVAHVGSLSVSGDGATLALAGFSPGLYCYALDGPPHRWLPLPTPCRLAALSYDGLVVLSADPGHRLHRFDLKRSLRQEYFPPSPPVALALSALGELAFAALADGTLVALGSAE